ncbi:Leucine-, isoleucine-, valine-, threonine-, and alanine-binding protein [Ralstonia syzygii]
MFKKAQVTALALASLVSCATAYADQSVVIGYAGPLTGGGANAGKDAENGVQLAIDEANSQNIKIGGQTVRFSVSVQDDAADPRQAVLVAQKLIDAKVAGVVGHLNSGATIPASKVYSDAGVPQISPSATNPMYTQQGFPTAFRVIGNDGTVARALVAQMKAEGKIKKVAVIDDATAYGQGLADLAVVELKKAGLKWPAARRSRIRRWTSKAC